VYVGDRGNRRIQVLDNDLSLTKVIDNIGARGPFASPPGPTSTCTVRIRTPITTIHAFLPVTGEVYKMELDGTVLGKFGKPGKLPGEFSTIHEIDCRNENEIYVGELLNWQKCSEWPCTSEAVARVQGSRRGC
jgi:hypothetical protein